MPVAATPEEDTLMQSRTFGDKPTAVPVRRGVKRAFVEAEQIGQTDLTTILEDCYYKQLENLKKAREKKAQYKQMDKQAIAKAETTRSLLSRASKAYLMLLVDQQRIQQLDLKPAFCKTSIPLPLPRLLYYAPALYHEFLGVVGMSAPLKKLEMSSASQAFTTQESVTTNPLVARTRGQPKAFALQ